MTEKGSVPVPGGKPSGHGDAMDRIETVVVAGDTGNDTQARADRMEAEVRRKSERLGPVVDLAQADYQAAARAIEAQLEEQELDRIERVAGMMVRDFVGAVYGKLNTGHRSRVFELIPSGEAECLSSSEQSMLMHTLLKELRYLPRDNDKQDPRYILVLCVDDRSIKHLVRKPTFRETPPGTIRNPNAPVLPPIATSELLAELAWMEDVIAPDEGAGKADSPMSTADPGTESPGTDTNGSFKPRAGFDTALTGGLSDKRSVRGPGEADTTNLALDPPTKEKIRALAGPIIGALAAEGLLDEGDMNELVAMAERDDAMLTKVQAKGVLERARDLDPARFDKAFEKRNLTIEGVLEGFDGDATYSASDLLGPSTDEAGGESEEDLDITLNEGDAEPGEVSDEELILTDSAGGESESASAAKPASPVMSEPTIVLRPGRSPSGRVTARSASTEPPRPDTEDEVKTPTSLPKSATGRYDRERLIGEGAREPLTDEERNEREEGSPSAAPETAKPSWLKRIARALLMLILVVVFVLLAVHAFLVHKTGRAPKMPTEASLAAVTSLLNGEPVVAPVVSASVAPGPLTMVRSTTAVKRGGGWVLFVLLNSALEREFNAESDLAPLDITFVKKAGSAIVLRDVRSEFARNGRIVLHLTIEVPLDGKIDGQIVDLNQIRILPVIPPQ